jgi:hypothetical protein
VEFRTNGGSYFCLHNKRTWCVSVCLSAAHILGTEMSGGTVIMNTGRSVPILIKTDPRDLMICDLNNFWNVTAKVVIMLHHSV